MCISTKHSVSTLITHTNHPLSPSFLPTQEWRASGNEVEKEYSLLRNDIDFRIAPPLNEGDLIGMSCGACFGLSVLHIMVGLATAPKVTSFEHQNYSYFL